jgi:hypothetical protein
MAVTEAFNSTPVAAQERFEQPVTKGALVNLAGGAGPAPPPRPDRGRAHRCEGRLRGPQDQAPAPSTKTLNITRASSSIVMSPLVLNQNMVHES